MLTKKKMFIIFSVLVLSVFVYVFTPKIESYFMWQRAVKAAGGFAYQIGLTSVRITACVPNQPDNTACIGALISPDAVIATTLCGTKLLVNPVDPEDICVNNSYVTGMMAGGMGGEALFTNSAILQVGLSPGGQLIAGGLGPTLMNSGVLASVAGCSGCIARLDIKNKIRKWFYDFIIAGKRGN